MFSQLHAAVLLTDPLAVQNSFVVVLSQLIFCVSLTARRENAWRCLEPALAVSAWASTNAYRMRECPSWVCTASHLEAKTPRRIEESGGGSSHAGLLFVSWL